MSARTDVSIAFTAQAQSESAVFLKHFDSLIDPRQAGKVVYPLEEMLLLSLMVTPAGAGTFVDIALSGVKKACVAAPFSAVCQRHALA